MRTLGTISSSRCQTTRKLRRPSATKLADQFFTDELEADRQPAFAKATAGNLRGSKVGSPTEAALAAKAGGARRDRTDDLLLAKQALSQLSYGPAGLG